MNIASNYRPVICLPLLTSILADEIYDYLEKKMLLPEEQKGCRRKYKGTSGLLFIGKMILREVRMRKKNLAWIDYKKAYDWVPHFWIVDCLGMVGVSEQIKHFLSESMKAWRVDLTCNNQSLGGVDIKRGIFQDDSLSPLLFVLCLIPLTVIMHKSESAYQFSSNKEKINHLLFMDDLKLYAKNKKGLESLVQTVQIFSDDIGMEFGIDKCAKLVLKRGEITKFDGISLSDGRVMKRLIEGAGYKYLGILQVDQIRYTEMKKKVKAEYLRRVRKVLETKLNGGNIIKGINTWAVSLLRYSATFTDWNGAELTQLARRTRKLMTMHNALHPKTNVDHLYIPSKEDGRGLQGVEEAVKLTNLGLENYVKEFRERLLTAARSVDVDLIEPI